MDPFQMAGAQLELFETPSAPTEPTIYRADPEKVRVKLLRVLSEAKAANCVPWDRKTHGYWTTVFPQMANWLPKEEADRLRREFQTEMERLGG